MGVCTLCVYMVQTAVEGMLFILLHGDFVFFSSVWAVFLYTLLGYVETGARACSVFRAMRGHWPIEFGVGKHWC